MGFRWCFTVSVVAAALVACGSDDGGLDGSGAGGSVTGSGGQATGAGGVVGSGGASGAACHAAGTLQVSNSGATAYLIDGEPNPMLTLCRGDTYVFSVSAAGHPFYINRVQGTGTANAYSDGVTGNGVTAGTLTFAVPSDAPDLLYYNCSLHAAMTGMVHIVQ